MKNILLAAECPQLWTKLHKIRIQKHQEEASANALSHRDIQQQIVDYININIDMNMNVIINSGNFNTNAHKHQYAVDDISVELYHPSGKFIPLLRNEKNHDSDNDACSLDDTFSTRIRCIVHLITDEGKTNNNCNPCIRIHQDVNPGPLLIKGRYFEYNPDGMDFAGKKLIVKEEVNNKDEDGTGLNVWDGSLLLARFLEKYPNKVKGKTVLELGSGPAVVGISAAILGAKEVILSDLAYTLPLVQNNIHLNQNAINDGECNSIKCMEIDWFKPPSIEVLSSCWSLSLLSSGNLDGSTTSMDINSNSNTHMHNNSFPQVVLIADCIWLEGLVNPLMNTVEQLSHANHTEVIITYQRRGKAAHDVFWKRLRDAFTSIEELDTMAMCGLEKPESISLLICHR